MQMEKAQALLRASVDERRIPGYAVLVGQGNDLLLRESYGCAQWIPQERPMTLETMFDLASLTKLTAVWPLIIRLLDAGNRLLHIIKAKEGHANKELARFASQVEALCDKWQD